MQRLLKLRCFVLVQNCWTNCPLLKNCFKNLTEAVFMFEFSGLNSKNQLIFSMSWSFPFLLILDHSTLKFVTFPTSPHSSDVDGGPERNSLSITFLELKTQNLGLVSYHHLHMPFLSAMKKFNAKYNAT